MAKDISASHDVVLEIFERMENFFKRCKVYIQSSLDTELAEMLVKVVVKVMSILSIAMKEVTQSRTSESFLWDMFLDQSSHNVIRTLCQESRGKK